MIEWLKRNLFVIIFGTIIVLQFLTWQAVSDLRKMVGFLHDAPACDASDPCHVVVDR
ncbi:MAG: hypothetical protein WAK55_07270 [Xanthobacteraceae bacterium]